MFNFKKRQQKTGHFINDEIPIVSEPWDCNKQGHDYEVKSDCKLVSINEDMKLKGVNLFIECKHCKKRRQICAEQGTCSQISSMWEYGEISLDKMKELKEITCKKWKERQKEYKQKEMKPKKASKSKTKKEVK